MKEDTNTNTICFLNEVLTVNALNGSRNGINWRKYSEDLQYNTKTV